MIIFPAFPVYTISIGGVIATKIQSIEIWRMTRAVPPGSFERNGAVAVSVMIIIVISSGEWSIMSERGTSVSWKNKIGINGNRNIN